jgi:hypothetical protein
MDPSGSFPPQGKRAIDLFRPLGAKFEIHQTALEFSGGRSGVALLEATERQSITGRVKGHLIR